MDNTSRNDLCHMEEAVRMRHYARRHNHRRNATPADRQCCWATVHEQRITSAFESTSNFIIALARELLKLFQTTPNMSNSIQEPWKLSESECIIDDWLQSCETDNEPVAYGEFRLSEVHKQA